MTKGRKQGERAPKSAKPAPRVDPNKALVAQSRKLLAKHYANKYRTRRGG